VGQSHDFDFILTILYLVVISNNQKCLHNNSASHSEQWVLKRDLVLLLKTRPYRWQDPSLQFDNESQPSTRSSKTKLRSSWVFDHMPDKDRETRYFNKKTGNLEWRCRYCPKVYDLNGGSTIISNHLTGPVLKHGHELPRESVRDIKARNQIVA
jgi:hypothetical protein